MSNKVCQICEKKFKKKVTDYHLENEHGLTREEYDAHVSGDAIIEFEEVDDEVDETPEDEPEAETPSQTPSPEPMEAPPGEGTPVPSPEPIEIPLPVKKPLPSPPPVIPPKKGNKYKLGPGHNKKFFLDPVSKFRINKRGKPGAEQELPDVLTPAIMNAIERKIIVPVED